METIDFESILSSLASIRKEDHTTVKDIEYKNIDEKLKEEEYRKAKLENDAREGDNVSDIQDRKQRKEFAENIFKLACYYMFFVLFILFLCGSPNAFHLSDAVLVTLLGTTTANIIGVLIVVVTYLFSRKKK